jgi:hypothetical protein
MSFLVRAVRFVVMLEPPSLVAARNIVADHLGDA